METGDNPHFLIIKSLKQLLQALESGPVNLNSVIIPSEVLVLEEHMSKTKITIQYLDGFAHVLINMSSIQRLTSQESR